MGKQYQYVKSEKDFSKIESERIVRLPLFYGLTENEVALVGDSIKLFL